MEPNRTDPAAQRTHLLALLQGFGVGMLTTTGLDGAPHARPLAVAEVKDDGTVWFSTHAASVKVEEIRTGNTVGVTFQSKTVYLAFAGKATVVRDAARVAALWSESWRSWYPAGPTDPHLVLLEVSLQTGEYWDLNGVSGFRFLFAAAKALATGTPMGGGGPDQHGVVALESPA